ncbi:MAG: bacteriocin [Oscillospiraceae bacterium]|nr:bacteriocin [Oscillospiraceae bacterium]
MKNNFTPELIEKARQAQSVEELMTLAEENGITITENEARDYFAQLNECNQSGELSDDELANVSGGGCYYNDGRLVVTAYYHCKHFTCMLCHKRFSQNHYCPKAVNMSNLPPKCVNCKYRTHKGIRMLCNHPDNYKK